MRTERTNKKYTSLDKTWSKNDNTKYKNQMNRAKIQIQKVQESWLSVIKSRRTKVIGKN